MQSTVLVYIPCHTDFSDALNQVETLRHDFLSYSKNLQAQPRKLYVVVSVNAYQPENSEKVRAAALCDQVLYYGDALLADVNISQGYLVSLQLDPEIFWLLSANDKLLPNTLSRIISEFDNDPDLDLIVANSVLESTKYQEHKVKNINGVISGVVYKTTRLKKYFNVAPFFPWTGWSHLAVIESAINGNGGLSVLPIHQDLLFMQTNRSLKMNGSVYAHSFTGDMIQKFLFSNSSSQRKKSLRYFVRSNFYRAHLYGSRDTKANDMNNMVNPKHYLSWNSLIAESLLKANTPFSYIIYKIAKKIPFESLEGISILRRIQKRL